MKKITDKTVAVIEYYCNVTKYRYTAQPYTLLSQLEIVTDKMHFAGHVDSWCKTCDPHLFSDLKKVCIVLLC